MTEEKRIVRFIIGWVVLSLAILIGMVVAWALVLIRPKQEEMTKTQTENDAQKVIAQRLPEAMAKQAKAEDKARYMKAQLEFFRGSDDPVNPQRFDPNFARFRRFYFDLGSKDTDAKIKTEKMVDTWHRLLNEYYSNYGLELKQELIDIANRSGVTINTSVKVDAPPKHPEDVQAIIPKNGFLKPAGATLTVTTTGTTLSNILLFLNQINQAKILLVVGNIKLEGTSPNIKASFTLAPYLLAAGPDAEITAGGAAPAAAAPPGGAPGPTGPAAGGGGKKPPAEEKPEKEDTGKAGVKNRDKDSGGE